MDHHVYFWLHEEFVGKADRAAFEQALASLLEIPSVATGRWAVPAAVEERPVVDLSWHYALDLKFASVADHDAYQSHPIHKAFVEGNKHRWQRVLVMDLA